MSELFITIIVLGLAIALFAATCAFAFKSFEFFFETSWTRLPRKVFTLITVVLGSIVFAFVSREKPKYRFNHTTGQPELISEGWGFAQKFGVFMALFWIGFISFIIVSFFR